MELQKDKRELIEAVNSSAHSLLILVNDILDFSKIEAGELTIEKIPFDLRKNIQQVIILQNPIAQQKGLLLKSEISPDIPASIIGDPSRLQQIINNLISNALKFTEEGSVTISIAAENRDHHSYLKFSVSDTGIGIAADKQKAIFKKFQQADTSTTRKYGGTGLGLTITKDLVELMGGRISVQSKEGKGSIFTIEFSAEIADEETEAIYPEYKNPVYYFNTKARLLVVDDHPINLLFMRQTLTNFGFTDFDEASNGKEALKLCVQKNYDLILMDCQMPDMDGYEAARAIMAQDENDKGPVIIAVTANAMKGASEKCLNAGMNDYISKPVDNKALCQVLQKWLPGTDHHTLTGLATNDISSSDHTDLFNWSRLSEFTDGNEQAQITILEIFLENLESDIRHLQNSFKAHDFREWDYWVHKIYGSCSHVGANAMAEICDQGQSLQGLDRDSISGIHSTILKEYERVSQMIKVYSQNVDLKKEALERAST